MAGQPFEHGRYLSDAGQVGGDIQVSIAPSRQFAQRRDDGTFTVITEYAYATPIENAKDGWIYDVENQTEIMHCRDLEDIGGTEITCSYEYEFPNAFAFRTKRDATRYARRYIRNLNIEHYGWDAVTEGN